VNFTAINFKTPNDISWDMGDGTMLNHQGSKISHRYSKSGTYQIKAYDWQGDQATIPVTLQLIIQEPPRWLVFTPEMPRVDQLVYFEAKGFRSNSIDWNFGDGTPLQTGSASITHRFTDPGTLIVSAKEHDLDILPVQKAITILPDNRSIVLSSSEVRTNEPLTITAVNFYGNLIAWDFGDRTPPVSGPATMIHAYNRLGDYTITARDENGASSKNFQARVKVLGLNDQLSLEIAEISLDNKKAYKAIPKNSKNIKAQLRMKIRGTGIVSGYWIVDGRPYEFFNETVYQGQLKTIFTKDVPGLPVLDPGMHTITIQLTSPAMKAIGFSTIRYFVLPCENMIEILSPHDGSIIKEDEIPVFTWQQARGGSYYQIAFSDSLLPLLQLDASLKWQDCKNQLHYTPDAETWKSITRNQWTYWKVRAMDSSRNILAESNIQEIKIIIPGVTIGIQKITDMDGRRIKIGNNIIATKINPLLLYGYLAYASEAEFLVLQIYANDILLNQLLFRDVKKGEKRFFDSSIPNTEKESRLVFQVLKTSSPSVVVGLLEIKLKKEGLD
jgi:PKD repeat protein